MAGEHGFTFSHHLECPECQQAVLDAADFIRGPQSGRDAQLTPRPKPAPADSATVGSDTTESNRTLWPE